MLLKNSARSGHKVGNADYSSSERFLTCDTLATMSITYYQVDSLANEPFDLPLAMAKRELL